MNKYQEALKIVKQLNYASESDKRNEYSTNDVDEAHKTLQELVDKATPKKPDIRYRNICFNLVKFSYCPNCENEINEDEHHCRCGQAID